MALIIFLFITSVSAQCLEDDNCEKIEFPHAQDEMRIKRNYSLQGHLLSEHYSFNYYGCFTRCSVNCQCLSFNLKRNSGVGPNCQLNGAASYTDPESVKPKIGWTYIEMVRSYLTKPPWQICSSDSCNNGCCQSTPCENGGTCSEVCDIRAKRFKCACPPGYTGDKCQEAQRSCHDILLSGIHANGIYQIRNEANETLNVYCDFDSEPGAAWTLIQSYSLENGQSGGIDNDIFSTKPLFEDFPVNGVFRDNWSSYRLSLDDMKLIRAYSTHWRATCEFPTIGIDFRDYFRVLLQDYDVIEEPPMYTTYCKRYEFMNVRGNQCLNCYARTGVFEDRAPYILSYYLPGQGLCNFYGRPYEGIVGEHNFGYYKTPNPAFRCSAGSNSTTQYWFGKM